jgi:hypothetical protein
VSTEGIPMMYHLSLWSWSSFSISILKSGNWVEVKWLDSDSKPGALSTMVHHAGDVDMWFPVFQELQPDSKI